jgi:zinc protease
MRGGTLYLSAVLPLGADDPEFAALVVANAIFGGSVDSRLFGRVREREGLSYSIASRLRPRVGEPVTLWTLEATYDLANADRVRAAVRDELARARLLGFTADEVAVAIGGYLSRALLRRGDDAVLAEQLTAMTPTSMAELEKRIARVTPQQATTAFRRFVREEVLTTLAVVAAER